jgi:hypothetical protein
MHCFERPTVELILDVPGGCPDETRPAHWEWIQCQQITPVREFAYTPEEICRLVKSYGELCSITLRGGSYPRFRLRVRGAFTGRMLGAGHWVWNAMAGRYEPHGELWLTIPPKHEWPEEVLRAQSVRSGETGGRPCRGCTLT